MFNDIGTTMKRICRKNQLNLTKSLHVHVHVVSFLNFKITRQYENNLPGHVEAINNLVINVLCCSEY
jgi:hypothetical protein